MCLRGLFLLFIGLWIAIQVFNEVLTLYKDPTNIERIAVAIEARSNIDKSITPIRDSILNESLKIETKAVTPRKTNSDFRISRFIVWIAGLLLLILLTRIAIIAIKRDGELTPYDVQIKKHRHPM